MKLKVVANDWPCGARSHALTTEDGTLLPGQQDVTINHNFNGASLITVTFVIDGKNIAIDKSHGV